MTFMLCRNKIRDFDTWKTVFDEQIEIGATGRSGLELERVWRSDTDPNEVFFLFRITDRPKAEAFVHAPESVEAGRCAGVIEGEIHYVSSID